jgi:endonuclease YncB( thermonuclease family)
LEFLEEISSDITLEMEFFQDKGELILVDLRLFGGQSLGFMMIKEGYARIKKRSIKNYSGNVAWEKAENDAKNEEIGMWMCDDRLSQQSQEPYLDEKVENISFSLLGGDFYYI